MKKLGLIIFISFIISCNKTGVFEKTVVIPSQSWKYSYKPSFTFNITDTTADYNVYLVLRHTDAYKYNNIWLNLTWQPPADSAHNQNVNFSLASDPKGWEGQGMDDIYELRKNIFPGPTKLKAGAHTFTIAQIMREDPIGHILNIGIRVEKFQ